MRAATIDRVYDRTNCKFIETLAEKVAMLEGEATEAMERFRNQARGVVIGISADWEGAIFGTSVYTHESWSQLAGEAAMAAEKWRKWQTEKERLAFLESEGAKKLFREAEEFFEEQMEPWMTDARDATRAKEAFVSWYVRKENTAEGREIAL